MAIDTEFVTQDEFKGHCEAIDKTLENHGKKLDVQGQKMDLLAFQVKNWNDRFDDFKKYAWAIIILLITLVIGVYGFLITIQNTLTAHILGK
jgi:hypothetical protein